jgi:phage-related tail protein
MDLAKYAVIMCQLDQLRDRINKIKGQIEAKNKELMTQFNCTRQEARHKLETWDAEIKKLEDGIDCELAAFEKTLNNIAADHEN